RSSETSTSTPAARVPLPGSPTVRGSPPLRGGFPRQLSRRRSFRDRASTLSPVVFPERIRSIRDQLRALGLLNPRVYVTEETLPQIEHPFDSRRNSSPFLTTQNRHSPKVKIGDTTCINDKKIDQVVHHGPAVLNLPSRK